MDENTKELQRLDKWLKIARIYKTRAIATRACEDRRVKVNGRVAKPSKTIKSGDELTIKTKNGKYVTLHILEISHKSISTKDARLLYKKDELEISDEEKEMRELFRGMHKMVKPKYKGRPTKKERRNLEKFKDDSYLLP